MTVKRVVIIYRLAPIGVLFFDMCETAKKYQHFCENLDLIDNLAHEIAKKPANKACRRF